MVEIGNEQNRGMLIYHTFDQRWVDSYVKCGIIYKIK